MRLSWTPSATCSLASSPSRTARSTRMAWRRPARPGPRSRRLPLADLMVDRGSDDRRAEDRGGAGGGAGAGVARRRPARDAGGDDRRPVAGGHRRGRRVRGRAGRRARESAGEGQGGHVVLGSLSPGEAERARALHADPPARQGGHGPRLAGPRRLAGPPDRAEGAAPRPVRQLDRLLAVPLRGQDHGAARAPGDRAGLRAGRGRCAVLHHAVRPGPHPERGDPGLPQEAGRRRGRPGRADRPAARRSPASATPWRTRIRGASSTATSRARTSCWATSARSSCSTGGWPSASGPTRPGDGRGAGAARTPPRPIGWPPRPGPPPPAPPPGLDDDLTLPEDPDGADLRRLGPGRGGPPGLGIGLGLGSGYGSNGHPGSNGSAHHGRSSARRGLPESGAGPEGTMQGQLLGTPAYMAPEQAQARHDLVDQRTDIYGLGAILYEILTGRPPFVAPKTSEVIRKVCQEAPTPAAPDRPGDRAGPGGRLPEGPAQGEGRPLPVGRRAGARRSGAAWPTSRSRRTPSRGRCGRSGGRGGNKTKVAAAAALLVTATIALGVSTLLVSRERNEAEAQGQQARQAVHLLTKVADIGFDDQLDPVQKEILENALTYYEKFTGRASGNPAVRLEHGRAYQQMGDIQRKLGRLGESEAAYRKAIAMLEPLTGAAGVGARGEAVAGPHPHPAGRPPGPPRGRQGPGGSALPPGPGGPARPGRRQAGPGRRRRGSSSAWARPSRARATCCGSTASSPRPSRPTTRPSPSSSGPTAADAKHPEARNELALAIDARGWIHRDLGDAAAAEADYRRAVELLEKLVAEFPTVPRHRESLAKACNSLGRLEQEDRPPGRRREPPPPRAPAGRAAGPGLPRPARAPPRAGPGPDQSRYVSSSSRARSPRPSRSSARPSELNSRDRWPGRPTTSCVRFQLAISHHDLGIVLPAQGDAEAAIASFRAARAINEALARQFPDKPRYLGDLADNLDSLALAQARPAGPGPRTASAAANAIYEKLVAAHPRQRRLPDPPGDLAAQPRGDPGRRGPARSGRAGSPPGAGLARRQGRQGPVAGNGSGRRPRC